jgi:hypothetical protein
MSDAIFKTAPHNPPHLFVAAYLDTGVDFTGSSEVDDVPEF